MVTRPSTVSRSGPAGSDEDILGKAYDPRIMSRLLEFLRPYRLRIALAFVVMVIRACSGLAGPYLIRLAIDDGIGKRDLNFIGQVVIAYLVAAGFNWLTNFGQIYIMAWVGQHVIYTLRTHLFAHLQELTLSFYD